MEKPLFKNRWLLMVTGCIFVMLCIIALLAVFQPIDRSIPEITTSNNTTDDTTNNSKQSAPPSKTNTSGTIDSNAAQQTTSESSAAQITNTQDDESLPPISPKMAAEIQRLEDHSTEGLITKQRADGSAYMNLQGRMQTTTVAVVDKNGKLIIRHGGDFLPDTDIEKTSVEKKQ